MNHLLKIKKKNKYHNKIKINSKNNRNNKILKIIILIPLTKI